MQKVLALQRNKNTCLTCEKIKFIDQVSSAGKFGFLSFCKSFAIGGKVPDKICCTYSGFHEENSCFGFPLAFVLRLQVFL